MRRVPAAIFGLALAASAASAMWLVAPSPRDPLPSEVLLDFRSRAEGDAAGARVGSEAFLPVNPSRGPSIRGQAPPGLAGTRGASRSLVRVLVLAPDESPVVGATVRILRDWRKGGESAGSIGQAREAADGDASADELTMTMLGPDAPDGMGDPSGAEPDVSTEGWASATGETEVARATSDADGWAMFSDVAAGHLLLAACDESRAGLADLVVDGDGGRGTVRIARATRLRVRLDGVPSEPARAWRCAAIGDFIESVEVRSWDTLVELGPLPPGEWVVAAVGDGGLSRSETVVVGPETGCIDVSLREP